MKFPPDYAGLAGRTLKPLAEQPIPFATLVEQAVVRLKAEGLAAEDSEQAEEEAEEEASAASREPTDVDESAAAAAGEAIETEPAADAD